MNPRQKTCEGEADLVTVVMKLISGIPFRRNCFFCCAGPVFISPVDHQGWSDQQAASGACRSQQARCHQVSQGMPLPPVLVLVHVVVVAITVILYLYDGPWPI